MACAGLAKPPVVTYYTATHDDATVTTTTTANNNRKKKKNYTNLRKKRTVRRFYCSNNRFLSLLLCILFPFNFVAPAWPPRPIGGSPRADSSLACFFNFYGRCYVVANTTGSGATQSRWGLRTTNNNQLANIDLLLPSYNASEMFELQFRQSECTKRLVSCSLPSCAAQIHDYGWHSKGDSHVHFRMKNLHLGDGVGL